MENPNRTQQWFLDHPEPVGLARVGWKTGEKRKDHQSKETQQKPKKRRKKLLYPTLPEEWGHDVGETIDRLEEEETQRMAFLKDGGEDMKIGSKSKQLTIKTWTKTEMFCRKLILSVIDQITAKSEFNSSLLENLEVFISSKSVANLPVWMIEECPVSSPTILEHQHA